MLDGDLPPTVGACGFQENPISSGHTTPTPTPLLSPPLPPPAFGPRHRPSIPPEAEGTSPLPSRGPRRPGGTQLSPHAARPHAPHRLLPRGPGQAGEPALAHKGDTRTAPRSGKRTRTGAVWGPRPP